MKSAQAVTDIAINPTNTAVNNCVGIFNVANCENFHSNLAVFNGAPQADENIVVHGSQDIDQSNTCDDDGGGGMSCTDDAGFPLGNLFQLEIGLMEQANLQLDNFEQSSTQVE